MHIICLIFNDVCECAAAVVVVAAERSVLIVRVNAAHICIRAHLEAWALGFQGVETMIR